MHYLSYATGGTKLGSGEQMPYKGSTDERYFHVSTSCVWETSLLVDFEAQAVNSHTGFITFMMEYRMRNRVELPFSIGRARQAFARVFYGWTYLRFRAELGLPLQIVKLGDAHCRRDDDVPSDLDQTLLSGDWT